MRQLLVRIKPYVWPDKNEAGGSEVRSKVVKTGSLIATAKGISVITPWFYKQFIDSLAVVQSTGQLDTVAPFILPFALWGSLHLLEPITDQYKSYTFATVKQRTTRVIGRNLIEKLFSLDHRFHSNRETGALLKAVDRGNRAISTVLHASCIVFAPAVFQVLMTGGMIAYNCGSIHATTLLATSVFYSWFSLYYTKYRTPFRIAMNKADMEAGNLATDSLLNYETVKYFGNERFEATRYDGKLSNFEQAALKTDKTLALLNLGQQVILGSCLVLNLGLAGHGVANGVLTVGDVVMIAAYFQAIQRPLSFLGSTYRDLTQAKTDFETMWNLMESKTEMSEGPNVVPQLTDGAQIEFRDVSFGYNNDKLILNGLNLSIAPGEKVAVVGGSGSGKSTIARLLFRFYDPKNGEIIVNNQNIKDASLSSVRSQIGVVPQDCVLFNDTIYENIRYGKLDATPEEIYGAAEAANLHESIKQMPDGYNTIVGERGTKLSGGEKQRLAIARCTLKNPNVVIYDEATSSLDSMTEQKIMESLDSATTNKSLLVIAHRLSTIVNSDKIIVIQDGKAVEEGTHQELLALNGQYKVMWETQTKQLDKPRDDREKEAETKRKRIGIESIMGAKTCCGGRC